MSQSPSSVIYCHIQWITSYHSPVCTHTQPCSDFFSHFLHFLILCKRFPVAAISPFHCLILGFKRPFCSIIYCWSHLFLLESFQLTWIWNRFSLWWHNVANNWCDLTSFDCSFKCWRKRRNDVSCSVVASKKSGYHFFSSVKLEVMQWRVLQRHFEV